MCFGEDGRLVVKDSATRYKEENGGEGWNRNNEKELYSLCHQVLMTSEENHVYFRFLFSIYICMFPLHHLCYILGKFVRFFIPSWSFQCEVSLRYYDWWKNLDRKDCRNFDSDLENGFDVIFAPSFVLLYFENLNLLVLVEMIVFGWLLCKDVRLECYVLS